jgi:AcrR family transcriptional regulator
MTHEGVAEEREAEGSLEAQRRQQLMRATMECVAEVGVEKTTMWMVAKRAGVSTGMVLYYYPNKRELITSAVKLAALDFGQRLQALAHGTWGIGRLKESMEVFLSESRLVPQNFLIQYRMAALNDAEIRRSSLAQYQSSRLALSKSVSAGQSQNQIRDNVDDMLLADLFYALANGLAAEVAAHPEIMSPERAAEVAQLALAAFRLPRGEHGQAASSKRGAAAPVSPTNGHAASTADAVQALLLNDQRLDKRKAAGLASAFRSLYEMSVLDEGSNPS